MSQRTIAAALVAVAAVAFASPAGGATTGEPTAAVAPDPPTVASVTELGPMQQHPAVLGRDNARSALFQGRSVWTFGDTMLSRQSAEGDNWADNSVAWTTDLDASDGVAGWSDRVDAKSVPAEFLPLTPQELAYNKAHAGDDCDVAPCNAELALWPGEIVADPERNRLLVFYGVIHRIAGDADFTVVGNSIATWEPGKPIDRPVVTPGSRMPTIMFGAKGFGLGNGSVVVGSTLYNYGCRPAWVVTRCEVARVALGDVLTKSAWRYYAGDGVWTSDHSSAVPVLDGGAAGTSVRWNPYLNAFLAVYSQNFSDDVMYRVAPAPEGPWSAATRMFRGVPSWNGSASYAASAHDEYQTGGGRVQYVTYVRNTAVFGQEIRQVRVVLDAGS